MYLKKLAWIPLFLWGVVATAESVVTPKPHSMELKGGVLSLSKGYSLRAEKSADADALDRLGLLLGEPSSKGVKVLVGRSTDASLRRYSSDIKPISGAYKLIIEPRKVVVVGYDDRGTYYAVRTLEQLIAADRTLPLGVINDYPDVALRGVVEGFYGKPWSHRDRISQLEFYGKYKLNTYIYGPKDDPYHSSPNWRMPYPEKEALQLAELVKVANQNKVDFVWAIHPGKDIKWNDEDYQHLLQKFDWMYGLGVRSFALFFDDISGDGTNPVKQADLLNFLHKNFVLKRGDVSPLILCPTEYNRSWADPKPGSYLDILGDSLDRSVMVMWTGDRVVSDITKEGLGWINKRIKRPAYIWWNFPVSDYVRDHMLLGRTYGLDADIENDMSAFVANPMEHAEASKVAIFSVAEYTWNMAAYSSEESWHRALLAVMPNAAEAFYTFAAHNSDLGPNGHGYRREESVDFKPAVDSLMGLLQRDGVERFWIDSVESELSRIAAAPSIIRETADNPFLVEELSPWLSHFEAIGQNGLEAIRTIRQMQHGAGLDEVWSRYLELISHRMKADSISRTSNKNPYQPGVKSGSLVVAPLVDALTQHIERKVYSTLSGRSRRIAIPISSFKVLEGADKMLDGDRESFLYIRKLQSVGDYVGLDLGETIKVGKILLLQGRNDGDHDIIYRGIMEYSTNGMHWQKLGEEQHGYSVGYSGDSVVARYVRYRVLGLGSEDGSRKNTWIAIRSFEVNPKEYSPIALTNISQLKGVAVRQSPAAVWLTPLLEVVKTAPQDYWGLTFHKEMVLNSISLDLGVPNALRWFKLEYSADGIRFQELPVEMKGGSLEANLNGVIAKEVRVINRAGAAREVYLRKFEVGIDTLSQHVDPLQQITDGNLTTSTALKSNSSISIPIESIGATQTLSVLFNPQGNATVAVFDKEGRSIYEMNAKGGVVTVDLTSLAPRPNYVTIKAWGDTLVYEVVGR